MERRGFRKKRNGIVVSTKMDKTVVVEVERRFVHPEYKKVVKHKKRFKAHDENNECTLGDKVVIMEIRPLSREKRWRVVSILGKAVVVEDVLLENEEEIFQEDVTIKSDLEEKSLAGNEEL
jgi:small subunit ribosomal protein S17